MGGDGPSHMGKRPTGSGGEPSSPNRGASAGVKARQLLSTGRHTHDVPPPRFAAHGALDGAGATAAPWHSACARHGFGTRCTTSHHRPVTTQLSQWWLASRPQAAGGGLGVSGTRHLLVHRGGAGFIVLDHLQLEWSCAKHQRMRQRRRRSQVQLTLLRSTCPTGALLCGHAAQDKLRYSRRPRVAAWPAPSPAAAPRVHAPRRPPPGC